ncbi:MAG: endonuclease/exonuclease/phosphatase family protein [Dysgonamonadaceae bacterium]|jgi:endonuclease/exonuclease/phosphatase family metal-dependent hydrolase|nr:endonuclease/exonuclease/phosphatase family protein [Dysgonamonadaceae bacterium]
MKKKNYSAVRICFILLSLVGGSLSLSAEDYYIYSGGSETAIIAGNTIDSVKAEAGSLKFYKGSSVVHTQPLPGSRILFTPANLNVMTLNVRVKSGQGDDPVNWNTRREKIIKLIRDEAIDILGTQETEPDQQNDLKTRLTEYATVGVGNGGSSNEHNSIFYRADRFTLIDSGTFWLSETPGTPGSKFPEPSYVRIATWAKLQDKTTERQLFAINTHLDIPGRDVAQEKQVKVLMEQIQALHGDLPVVLTGDFNMRPDNGNIGYILAPERTPHFVHARDAAQLCGSLTYSYHGYDKTPLQDRYLADYIFTGGPVRTEYYSVLPKTLDNVFLSDHAPVFAKITVGVANTTPLRLRKTGWEIIEHHSTTMTDLAFRTPDKMLDDYSTPEEWAEHTMWHSNWGITSALPFRFVIDMKASHAIDRFQINVPVGGASDEGKLKSGYFEVSEDNITWEKKVEFEMDSQAFECTVDALPQTAGRYIRFVISTAQPGSQRISVSNLDIFGF